MSHLHHFNLNFQLMPPPQAQTQVMMAVNPIGLMQLGFNLAMEVSTSTLFRQGNQPQPLKSIVVMAHFDTGASITCIDDSLAKHLQLIPVGSMTQHTAAGPRQSNNYSVDISFPNTGLTARQNLQVGSASLNFNIQNALTNANDPRNFGVLIGRDIMSAWNIVWNGPSSTILISD